MRIRSLGLLAVALAVVGAAHGGELRSRTLSLTLRDGVIVGFENHLCGESLVTREGRDPPRPKMKSGTTWKPSLPAGLNRIGDTALNVSGAIESTTFGKLNQSLAWSNLARFDLQAEIESASGDVIITQAGSSTEKKLAGISWGITDIPDSFEVLVPGCSGQRFSASAPMGRREFDYPIGWEASFVLIQGRKGGFLIRADDDSPRYKCLTLEHARKSFRLRFESRNIAPFEDKERIESSRWRITPYRGSWQTGAAIYRRWAESHRQLTPLAQQQPAWVRDTRFVVTIGSDPALLAKLADHCNPTQTLLYATWWRRDKYDRNYPDYTAATNFDAFVTEAHRLGFRVMAHVNYFGCHPENPVYEQVRHAHMRDPFSGKFLWWEWPANPPVKFAYINPASRAWRELFVERMEEVVRLHKVDALHLDQTLCIYNDANGLVDGMTCIEGSLALHREMRAALPEVALSGEGLNEISGQYEAFAQRHVWSMDHIHGTWDDRQIAMSHPVSSAVLAPYTHIYGYLGLPNPANQSLFAIWQRAYDPLGVIPTYNWPEAEQLANPPQAITEFFAHANFFQDELPTPDFDSPWEKNDLFVYRLADGSRAFYRQDHGVVFSRSSRREKAQNGKSPIEILSRRIDGVEVAKVDGSIPGWLAYDAKRILGLDPKQSYSWSAQPRDLRAAHIAGLPEDTILQQAGVHPDFARFRFGVAKEDSEILLWNFIGDVTPGVRFSDGTIRHGDALDFEDQISAGNVHPVGEGLSMHPPWKGALCDRRPATFIEYPLRLPKAGHITFESDVRMFESAVGKSDGVTFRAVATRGEKRLSAEVHNDTAKPKTLLLELTPFSGDAVRLRLEIDAGPTSNPSYDAAFMMSPRVVVKSGVARAMQTIRFAGLNSVSATLVGTNSSPLKVKVNGCAKLKLQMPTSLVLAFAEVKTVSIPCDLLQTRFTSHVLFSDGIELPPFGIHGGEVTNATCGGIERCALALHPPMKGRSVADWLVRLPEAPVRLVTAIGIRDGTKLTGVHFRVEVNGEPQLTRLPEPDSDWSPVEIDLTPWRGQPVLLTFVTESDGHSGRTRAAVWAEPSLIGVPTKQSSSR